MDDRQLVGFMDDVAIWYDSKRRFVYCYSGIPTNWVVEVIRTDLILWLLKL